MSKAMIFYSILSKTTGASAIPTCNSYCSDFYNACKNDYICFQSDAMKEILQALIDSGERFDILFTLYIFIS